MKNEGDVGNIIDFLDCLEKIDIKNKEDKLLDDFLDKLSDISDKSYKFIAFDEEKDASPESLPDFKDTFDTFKDYFKNKIAANRGLAPGKNENGCLSSILLIISSSMALLSVLLYVVFL